MEEEQERYNLSDAERESLALAREQTAKGEFASEEQLQAIWAKYRS